MKKISQFIIEEFNPFFTKDEIINILKRKQIPQNILNQAGHLLNTDFNAKEKILQSLKEILGPDAQYSLKIADMILLQSENHQKIAEYLQNRSVSLDEFKNVPKKLVELFSEKRTGISKKSLIDLIPYRWNQMPVIGPTEVALSILLDGGSRPKSGQAGDLIINNKNVEVKGRGGRLRGQRGYGAMKQIRDTWEREFKKIAQKYSVSQEEFIIPGDKITSKDWNWKNQWKGKNEWDRIWPGIGLAYYIVENRDFNPRILQKEIEDGIISGLLALHTAGDSEEIRDFIQNSFSINSKSVKFNYKKFYKDFVIYSFNYYVRQEDIELFCVTNASTSKSGPSLEKSEILLFEPQDFPKVLGKYIGVGSPSYLDSAGIQGVAFSLSLGSKSKLLS